VKQRAEKASGSLPKAKTSVSMPAGRVPCRVATTLPETSSGGSQRLAPCAAKKARVCSL
jgi:hypothetical protein